MYTYNEYKFFPTRWKMTRKESVKYFDHLFDNEKIPARRLKEKVLDYQDELIHVNMSRKDFFKYFLMLPEVIFIFSVIKASLFCFMSLFSVGIGLISIIFLLYYRNRMNKEIMNSIMFENIYNEDVIKKEDEERGLK